MPDIDVIFCRSRDPQAEEDGFELEEDAADQLGIACHMIPIEPIVHFDSARALQQLPRGGGRTYVYRGWLLSAEEYADLFDAISERGDTLLVDPCQYEGATYMPAYYDSIAHASPRTLWTESSCLNDAWETAKQLGSGPKIVRDHVKSAKELWHHACFIPQHVEREHFGQICDGLRDARGDRFERGFVFREFVALERLQYQMPERPVCNEHRLVFVGGELVAHAPYYDVGVPIEDVEPFKWLGEAIDSPFFAADVSRLETGAWTVIELHDGGIVSLPSCMDPRPIYEALLLV